MQPHKIFLDIDPKCSIMSSLCCANSFIGCYFFSWPQCDRWGQITNQRTGPQVVTWSRCAC